MSGLSLPEDFPPNIQAVLAVTEEGDGCVVCVELEAFIQTRRSLGAAALDWQAAPSFDRRAVEAHVSLLHDLAEGLDGVLILAAFEEGGMPNVRRFKIGDVANMVETIMGFDGHPRVNLYIPWAVMRRDLEPRKKGAEADVVAALAAVGDIDGDKGVKTELPVEAPYIVESSPGNFQPVYIFERPLPPGEAKPVLTAISDFIGGDSGTKDCSHVWRIPGTLNIPTKSKLARGRSPVPASVSIKKHYNGRLIDPGSLLALAPTPRLPNGHDTAPSGPLSFAEEARLRGALKVILPDDRDIWLKVGAALHLVGARAVWDDWSKTSGKFDADDQDRVWASFHAKRKEGVVTIATIYAWAKERGWNPAAAEQWTELGNAHRLVRRHGDDVRYVHPLKAWFIWDGVFWRRDDSGEIMRRAEATIEAIFDEAKEITDEEIRAALRKFALKSQARAQISAMVQLAQHQLRVVLSPGALDASPMLLGVLNGTIDLKACAFREGRRQDYITKQCAVAFDPQAQCPNWIEFQNKIAGGNAELVAYKQRVFGLLLTGEMVEILFILHGDGQNGKTTELETISGVLGDYAHAADAKILLAANDRGGATPEIVAIKGKRAIFINETDGSDHLNESRVKYLTGNDTMSGRDLFESIINFQPTHKPLLRTNHKPKIRGTDLGIWRRIHYWPYLVTIRDDEKVVKFREMKLDPERPGILNWMLAGLKDYLVGGLRPPTVVCQATKKYQREMNTVGQWIEVMCEKSTIDTKLYLSEIHEKYAKWSTAEHGWAASKQKLAEELRARGYEEDHPRNLTRFKLRLRPDEPDEAG